MVSHAIAAFVTAASCVGVPGFFGFIGPHASSEAKVISLLERQLQRCGPENQTCPPCLSQSYCGWSTLTATCFLGFIGGLLAAVTVGSVYLLCSVRRTTPEPSTRVGYTDRDDREQFDSPSSSPLHRRRGRPALPLAILSADQVRD